MLVTSSQPSTQRPLGLSIEELYALDRQYRRIEQQQQHLTQLQSQAHLSSTNLNRLASRSLDYISPKPTPMTALPSLEVHGHAYSYRPQPPPSSLGHYPRSHSIDQMRYIPPVPPAPSSSTLKSYQQRSAAANDTAHHRYHSRHRNYLQHPSMATGNVPTMENRALYSVPPPQTDYYDNRNSCKLRRQHPIKRESSRRILVRPVVQRRREPSISSSCESLDERGSSARPGHIEQSNIFDQSVPYSPSSSFTADVINELNKETPKLICTTSNNDSLSEDSDVNLYEMRLGIGKTYDTSDISVQLEGPKILIHCHTIEPTDKRGNYRKHEYKTELLVPDVVDDETIVAYLTEDGQLIVEGKYHAWAWKEIKKKRKLDQQENHRPPSPISMSKPTESYSRSTRNDGGLEREPTAMSLASSSQQMMSSTINNYNSNNNNNNNNNNNSYSSYVAPINKIERLDNNRTVIHVSAPSSPPPAQQYTDTRSVSDMISRFNTLNTTSTSTIWDGQYTFTNDSPPLLIYHARLPFETNSDSIRIQSDPQSNLLKVFVEQEERSSLPHQQQSKVIIRSTSRICRLPKANTYDFTRLHVVFLRDKYIRIELPTLS